MPLLPRRRPAAVRALTLTAGVAAVAATGLTALTPLPGPVVATSASPRATAVERAVASVAELRLRPAQAITGEPVDLRVTVEPAVARVVVLQQREADRWVEVTRGRTDASGVAVLTRPTPVGDTTYRVRAPRAERGGRTYAADVSPGRLLTVQRQDVFLRLPESVTAGSVATAVVECFPRRPGRTVRLWQRLGDGEWVRVARGVQGGTGIAQLPVSLPEEGVYEHRAVVAAANGAPEARSASRSVTVTAAP